MILAGDIGATNARLGGYVGGKRVGLVDLPTGEFPNANALLGAALAKLAERAANTRINACCLAVAGPVMQVDGDDVARLTNANLVFSRQAVAAAVGTPHGLVVNDMVAVGAAVAKLDASRFETLNEVAAASRPVGAAKGMVAAGTGLGMGVVVDGRCLPSEGGHARIAPVGAFERELVAFTESELADEGGIVAWEHYLSGRGVETLYRAVCAVWGAAAEPIDPAQITRRGLAGDDPVCDTAIRTWVGMLATAAGGLAATAMTLGGVYFSGSVALAVAPLLRQAAFRRRFREAAWAADFLSGIPLLLITDTHIGVDGAHLLAQALAQVPGTRGGNSPNAPAPQTREAP